MMRFWLIFVFALAVCVAPVNAQEADNTPEAVPEKTEAQKKREAEKAREEAERRIEAEMVTMTSLIEALSKNLGQLHYLRTLCFGASDQKWRDYASQMMAIETEEGSNARKALIRAFNAGYYQEEERHDVCNESVSVDVAALSENGRHISSMLGDPFRDF